MSRHEMDLEKAISHDPQKARALSILMTDVKPESDSGSKDDPMNNVKKFVISTTTFQSLIDCIDCSLLYIVYIVI